MRGKLDWINATHDERVVRGGEERREDDLGAIIVQLQYVEALGHRLARSVLKA